MCDTQFYLPPKRATTYGMSHPAFTPPAAERHRTLAGTISRHAEGRRLSWPRWLVAYRDGLSVRRYPGACGAMLLSTSSTAASVRPMLSVANDSPLQVAISSSCHDIVAPISAVGRLLLQARRPAWYSLPDYLRDPSLSEDTFWRLKKRRLLKTYLFELC